MYILSGIPWQFHALDSLLSLLRAWVQSLVMDLRSYKPNSVAKKKKAKPLSK